MPFGKKYVQSRKAVVAWFAEALLVNTPAEASQPDPLKAASSEFLMNVSVALLGLAMPVVRDENKFKKVSFGWHRQGSPVFRL